MPTNSDALKRELAQTPEVELTVTGRKSGRAISNPVWFVLERGHLFLLPVSGSESQWYKNVLTNPAIRIRAGKTQADLVATTITDATNVAAIADRFRSKYGAGDVQKYYSKFDVAVATQLH
jgi:deazaflavin-dependent oxidoreductase (nitroreductase family)